MTTLYCAYCGRVAHRCGCAAEGSRLRGFLARGGVDFSACWRAQPYKRGVPPQVKQQARARLRSHYRAWYAVLVAQYGERCLHCGDTTALAIDHVVPVAKGGMSELENLQVLCAVCNTAKGKLAYDCRPHTVT